MREKFPPQRQGVREPVARSRLAVRPVAEAVETHRAKQSHDGVTPRGIHFLFSECAREVGPQKVELPAVLSQQAFRLCGGIRGIP